MTVHHGSCHCGAIELSLAQDPTEISQCNCSLCRRIAGLWTYCEPAAVSVTGTSKGYIQGDRSLTTWHCPTCACTTHWTAVDPEYQRMGVNLRLFDPALLRGLPLREVDGASY